jgi:hypothetical protein
MLSLHSAPEKLLSGSFSILGAVGVDVKLLVFNDHHQVMADECFLSAGITMDSSVSDF